MKKQAQKSVEQIVQELETELGKAILAAMPEGSLTIESLAALRKQTNKLTRQYFTQEVSDYVTGDKAPHRFLREALELICGSSDDCKSRFFVEHPYTLKYYGDRLFGNYEPEELSSHFFRQVRRRL